MSRTAAAGHAFDVVEAKLRVPAPRPGGVSRTGLVNRLRVPGPHDVTTVVAPAGYGKTTVLAQWAERDDRPFAWVTLDERDADPAVLLRHVAAALHRVEPRTSLPRTPTAPRVAASLSALDDPVVLALDDVSRLGSAATLETVLGLADHLSPGSLLVLAGRALPAPRLATLRAAGRLVEVGPARLALTRREAELLLRAAGVELTRDELGGLLATTEGWPAGVALAALALRERDARAVGADDRFLADYLRAECLDGLPDDRLAFLRRTSLLDRLSGPLCDAVLGVADSARTLEALEADGLFVVPLDRSRTWFRYHRVFRELLRRELERHEPDRAALHARAAGWLEANGDPDGAIEHAAAAGDLARVARLVGGIVPPAFDGDRAATVERWLALFDGDALARHPAIAPLGAWVHAVRGRAAEAERWLEAAGDGPLAALVRAALCRDGVAQMLEDAEVAVEELSAESPWLPTALLLEGSARALAGDRPRAETVLGLAADAAGALGAEATRLAAVGERALVAAGGDDRALLDALAPGDGGRGPLERAVLARALLRRGRADDARAELASARRLTPQLTHALPWLAVQARLELVRAYITLRDAVPAAALLAEAEQILRRRPDLGVLPAQARDLAGEVERLRELRAGRRSALTGAELRLLPLLATHLSFREIGDRLSVSRNTIKTQAVSVYRKLGVSSRSEAIREAARLGLLDSQEFTPSG
jgi:LuxR family transcriptional regulator, maltose regulon positive regulatory protein